MLQKNSNARLWYFLSLIFILIALFFSLELSGLHYSFDESNWLTKSFCGAKGGVFDCKKVNESPLAKLFGMPMALWGSAFFIYLLFIQLWILISKEKLLSYLKIHFFWLIALGSIWDLFLFFFSIFYIKSLCPLCLVTYFALWLTLILAFFSKKQAELSIFNPFLIFKKLNKKNLEISFMKYLSLISLPAIFAFILAFSYNSYLLSQEMGKNNQKRDEIIQKIVSQFSTEKKNEIKLPSYPWYGDPSAPVSLVEFSDFMCPHCKRMAPLLKEFVQQSNGKVKLKFINHPLDMICNKNMSNQLHQGACEIAQGTFCANLQGKFWQYHDEIFAIQKHQISRKDILEKASIAGIELNQFEKCLTSKQAEKAIVDEIAEGDRLDIKGTPTIFINGKIYKFAIHPLILLKIVEAELKN